jgi:hypothetical protein
MGREVRKETEEREIVVIKQVISKDTQQKNSVINYILHIEKEILNEHTFSFDRVEFGFIIFKNEMFQ